MRWLAISGIFVLASGCAHRPDPLICRVMPRVREGGSLQSTVACDDASLVTLREQLAKMPETAGLVVTRSARIPGHTQRLLCVDRAPGQPCAVSPAPGGPPGKVFIAVIGARCRAEPTIAQLIKLTSLSDAELDRVREELMAKGWFRSAEVGLGMRMKGESQPAVVVHLEVKDETALCRAAGDAEPRASCPPQPACQFGSSCVTRRDGCLLCTCEQQTTLPRGLAELISALVDLAVRAR